MNHFGYYGKTIHRGDFVRYNLPQVFVTVWDDWIKHLIVAGEAKYSENWSSVYSNASPIRFGFSPSIAGNSSWIGIMLPTIDKLGRRFPFCIACALPEGMSPITGSLSEKQHIDRWYSASEDLLEIVLTEESDFDLLQTKMAELQHDIAIEPERISAQSSYIDDVNGTTQVAVVSSASTLLDTKAGLASVLDATLKQSCFHYSVWQSVIKNENGNALVTNGLPMGNLGLSLFDCQWAQSGAALLNVGALSDASELTTEDFSNDPVNSSNAVLATCNSNITGGPTPDVEQYEDQTVDLSDAGSTQLLDQTAAVDEPIDIDPRIRFYTGAQH